MSRRIKWPISHHSRACAKHCAFPAQAWPPADSPEPISTKSSNSGELEVALSSSSPKCTVNSPKDDIRLLESRSRAGPASWGGLSNLSYSSAGAHPSKLSMCWHLLCPGASELPPGHVEDPWLKPHTLRMKMIDWVIIKHPLIPQSQCLSEPLQLMLVLSLWNPPAHLRYMASAMSWHSCSTL